MGPQRRVASGEGLAVAVESRGRGVAAELLAGAERSARERGPSKISLRVLANAPTRRGYEKAGHVVEGTLGGHAEGRVPHRRGSVDDLVLAKHLT